MTRRTRGPREWIRAAWRDPNLSTSVKAYLSYLAFHMDAERVISRPRHVVADDLAVSRRRVDQWNTAAKKAGYLAVVTPGRKHVTAVYQGTFLTFQRAPIVRPETTSQSEADVGAENAQDCALRIAQRDPVLRTSSATPYCAPVTEPPPRWGRQQTPPNGSPDAPCLTDPCWGCERCTEERPGGAVVVNLGEFLLSSQPPPPTGRDGTDRHRPPGGPQPQTARARTRGNE